LITNKTIAFMIHIFRCPLSKMQYHKSTVGKPLTKVDRTKGKE
jgi:hypothetical protein